MLLSKSHILNFGFWSEILNGSFYEIFTILNAFSCLNMARSKYADKKLFTFHYFIMYARIQFLRNPFGYVKMRIDSNTNTNKFDVEVWPRNISMKLIAHRLLGMVWWWIARTKKKLVFIAIIFLIIITHWILRKCCWISSISVYIIIYYWNVRRKSKRISLEFTRGIFSCFSKNSAGNENELNSGRKPIKTPDNRFKCWIH